MDNKQTRIILVGVVAFIAGWIVGLVIFGWNIWPVEYTGAGPGDLRKSDQDIYLIALADLYSFDNNAERVQTALGGWEEAVPAICQLAAESTDSAQAARLDALAATLNNVGCGAVEAPAAEDEAGGGRGIAGYIALLCGLVLVVLVIAGVLLLIWQRRSGPAEDEEFDFGDDEPPPSMGAAETVVAEQQFTPIARFQTTYVRGHDTYDDSFSIENAEGDFLGECGVGLSETIGADSPKNVTAFEVWLFDKNDIRTVTKVVMSDHAFFDEAIKAKLAPKGEPILARPNEKIVLETASLIVNAEITELDYGTGTLPSQSFFDRFTVELSAWAKEGEFEEPNIQGQVDDMLDM